MTSTFTTVANTIKARKSVRAFTNQPVSLEDIKDILDAARYAPSGTNTQPWEVAVVQGATKRKLVAALLEKFDEGGKEKMDYHYYPESWIAPYKQRRLACGLALYSALEIKREDKERQREHWRRNFEGFDAPVLLFFSIDKILATGSYLDYGMFLQNVSLAAVAKGLGSCAQAALANYPDVVREQLGLSEDKVILCGMGLGYEDQSHPLNRYRTERESVDTFTKFYD